MQEPINVNANVTIKRERKPKRKHPIWDLIVIAFGCALIASPFHLATGQLIFGILFPICALLYLVDCLHRARRST